MMMGKQTLCRLYDWEHERFILFVYFTFITKLFIIYGENISMLFTFDLFFFLIST